MSDDLLQQTNKRLTLNLLIQGAAVHTFLTAHHLVREELESIRPGLIRLYDRMAVSLLLNYCIGDIPLICGLPSRFWRRTHRETHPFHRHRLLSEYGGELWRLSKQDLVARSRRHGVIPVPGLHYVQMFWLFARVAWAERRHRQQLAELALKATSLIWGIDQDRLEAKLTTDVAFGHIPQAKTPAGRIVQSGAIGYGGVQWRDGRFVVVAKSWVWPLVVHELVKGTAELVCLHGLNSLDDETYEQVTDEADQIEYETWMLQAGGEMWRQLLSALPRDRPLAEMLMHIARLDPEPLERLMLAVAADPARARHLMQQLQ